MITIYTDGSFNIHQGVGGWAAITLENGVEKEYSGSSKDANSLSGVGKDIASSQRMEIVAVLEGLLTLTNPSTVEIISDSRYVVDTMNKGWLESWIRENKSDKKHLDLWKIIYTLSKLHNLKFTWVKGHDGNHYNERCDYLAQRETQKLLTLSEMANRVELANELEESRSKENLFVDDSPPFEELKEAFELSNEKPAKSKKKSGNKKTKKKEHFYAVAKGRKTGVFKSWNECNKSVNKYRGAIFKKFYTEEEALNFIRNNK